MLVVAAVALAAPGSARPTFAADDAASVNGETISVEDFEAMVEAAGQVAPDYAPNPATDTIGAAQGRELLKIMILTRIRPGLLAEHDLELTDDDVAAAEASVTENEQGNALPEPLRSELVNDTALSAAVAQLPVPDEAALAALYDESPAQTGVMCLNVISIVGDAEHAADELRGGASANDVVAEAGNGSRVQDECLSLGELGLSVPGLFHEHIELRPGELLDPIETSNGHQILQVASFDDIAGELVGYFADPPVSPGTGQPQTVGDLLLMGYVVTADVSVNPRYGRWDAATVSVVPLGQP